MAGVGVVITAFDQGELVRQAVSSVLRQSRLPDVVLVVDDGSTDPVSSAVLTEIEESFSVRVLRQANAGVSAARNTGLRSLGTDLAVVLDGDDRLAPSFVERTTAVLEADSDVVAASTWLRMHGAATALVRPAGGRVVDFLHRNSCPAAVLLRCEAWERCGGYDEALRDGFEDWDFFLSLLADGGRVEIVPEALVEYRTAPASANLRSMRRRLDLYGGIIDRHRDLYERHLREVLLAHEERSIELLRRWEQLMVENPAIAVDEATYGDGGMAAVVRVETARQRADGAQTR